MFNFSIKVPAQVQGQKTVQIFDNLFWIAKKVLFPLI